MSKMISVLAIILVFLSSCNETGKIDMEEHKYAQYLVDEFIESLNNQDKERLETLFSKNALDNSDDFNNQFNALNECIGDSIVSYDFDGCLATSMSVDYGDKTNMIRFGFTVTTSENETYNVFIIAYNIDTVNEDNLGIYMLETANSGYHYYKSWQERMTPGIVILKSEDIASI